jgi:hypothetical protein
MDLRLFSEDIKQVKQVKQAITDGADVNQTNSNGETPLSSAIYAKQWVVAKELLASGAEYLIFTSRGNTIIDRVNLFMARPLERTFARRLAQLVCPHSALIRALFLNERKKAHDLIRSGEDLTLRAARRAHCAHDRNSP